MPALSSIAGDGAPSGSSSAIVAGATSGYHELRIDGYSRTKQALPNGKHVDSRPFSVAGHTWVIRYYPNGVLPDNADYIALFLVLKSSTAEDVLVQFVLSFIDQVKRHAPSFVSTGSTNRFSAKSCSYGRTEFIKREDLEQSERLKDDCFTIRCDMIVIGKLQADDTVASSSPVPPPDWPQHFSALLMSQQGADVRFSVGGEVFAAHRCVLAARSPVFKANLFGEMKEGTNTEACIWIDDMMPQVFKCLLHFIYTDSLPELEGQEEEESIPVMAQHLLEAADRYDMQRLKLICENRLRQSIEVGTVATTLALAEQHHCQGLKEACFDFLKSSKMLDAVKETDGFQHLVKSCPSALVEFMSSLLPADKRDIK